MAEIPNRPLFKASEVCEVAQVQPYVLRSWEQEFPDLGHARPGAAARVYRRSDLVRVLRIRQLVFDEGLTLSGARRKMLEEAGELEGDGDLPFEEGPRPVDVPKAPDFRARLAHVRTGLRSVLDLLDRTHVADSAASTHARVANANGRHNGKKTRSAAGKPVRAVRPATRVAKGRGVRKRRSK